MRAGGVHIATALLVGAVTIFTPGPSALPTTPPSVLEAGAAAAAPTATGDYAAAGPEAPTDVLGAAGGAQGAPGAVRVTVTVRDASVPIPPTYLSIYRFYSAKTGTHFYTATAAERDHVIRTWPDVWTYEGVAYSLNRATNAQPLYRFWNRVNGAHFYTVSAQERDIVIARWSRVFAYEGEVYQVSLVPTPGAATVYRFYNRKNGSHFYTASPSERDIVLARWSGTYQLEGGAFYLAP